MRPVSFWERYSIQKHAGNSERLTNASADGCWPLSQERGLCKNIQSESMKPNHMFHLMSVCSLNNSEGMTHTFIHLGVPLGVRACLRARVVVRVIS